MLNFKEKINLYILKNIVKKLNIIIIQEYTLTIKILLLFDLFNIILFKSSCFSLSFSFSLFLVIEFVLLLMLDSLLFKRFFELLLFVKKSLLEEAILLFNLSLKK